MSFALDFSKQHDIVNINFEDSTMGFKDFLSEGTLKKRVKIEDGEYKGQTGLMVFSKIAHSDTRYYVVELDQPVKGVEVVIVLNGEYDFL